MKTTTTLALALALLASGCASRHAILTVPAVSMTTPSVQEGSTASAGEPVAGRYCRGDDPVVSKDGNIGLIDEAVMIAQRDSGARYLKDVTIFREGSCVVVEATAMK
jgi:hypothetical protein